mgnify:CR=1 FL=1|nr:MAG TPA: hypothetical protein [Caudoviricetes sp.]
MTDLHFIAERLEGYGEVKGFEIISAVKKDASSRFDLVIAPMEGCREDAAWIACRLKGYEGEGFHFAVEYLALLTDKNYKLTVVKVKDAEDSKEG